MTTETPRPGISIHATIPGAGRRRTGPNDDRSPTRRLLEQQRDDLVAERDGAQEWIDTYTTERNDATRKLELVDAALTELERLEALDTAEEAAGLA